MGKYYITQRNFDNCWRVNVRKEPPCQRKKWWVVRCPKGVIEYIEHEKGEFISPIFFR